MGFSYLRAKKILEESKGDLEQAINLLLGAPESPALKREKSIGGEYSFLHGLYVCVRLKLKYLTQNCSICGKKHSCNSESEKPVICSDPLCMFRYEELGMGVKQDHIFLCPFTICPEKVNFSSSFQLVHLFYINSFSFFHKPSCSMTQLTQL